jgi:hypothetical protein
MNEYHPDVMSILGGVFGAQKTRAPTKGGPLRPAARTDRGHPLGFSILANNGSSQGRVESVVLLVAFLLHHGGLIVASFCCALWSRQW